VTTIVRKSYRRMSTRGNLYLGSHTTVSLYFLRPSPLCKPLGRRRQNRHALSILHHGQSSPLSSNWICGNNAWDCISQSKNFVKRLA